MSIPSKSDKAATKQYADRVGNDVREYLDKSSELLRKRFHDPRFAFLKDNGNFVAHTPISLASKPLNDLLEPKKTSDTVSKRYVDDLNSDNVGVGNMNGGGSPFFKENGNYQATHAINMAFKSLLNLSTPPEPFEAATKKYVDKKPHIIAVHANYYGPLRKGEYQFALGGSAIDPNGSTGFLVPQSGRIKKIQVEIKLDKDYYELSNTCRAFPIVTKNPEKKKKI